MNCPHLMILALTLASSGSVNAAEPMPSATEIESLGQAHGTVFQADNCTITAVDHGEDVIYVQFTGRWLSSATFKWADTHKNGFSVTREKSVPPSTWKKFTQQFDDCRNKRVTVLIVAERGYVIRGGIPFFTYPSGRFQIGHDGVKFDFPVGYQF